MKNAECIMKKAKSPCHSCENGNPGEHIEFNKWIPASAGMTVLYGSTANVFKASSNNNA